MSEMPPSSGPLPIMPNRQEWQTVPIHSVNPLSHSLCRTAIAALYSSFCWKCTRMNISSDKAWSRSGSSSYNLFSPKTDHSILDSRMLEPTLWRLLGTSGTSQAERTPLFSFSFVVPRPTLTNHTTPAVRNNPQRHPRIRSATQLAFP